MVITINSREYVLHFGVGFVRALDEKYFVAAQSGVKIGIGLSQRIPYLLSGDVVALAEILYEGTCTEDKRPAQKDVDRYIDECEDIDALFDEVISELKKSNATGRQTRQLEEEMKLAQEAEKAKAARAKKTRT